MLHRLPGLELRAGAHVIHWRQQPLPGEQRLAVARGSGLGQPDGTVHRAGRRRRGAGRARPGDRAARGAEHGGAGPALSKPCGRAGVSARSTDGHGDPGTAHCGQTPCPVALPHRRPRGIRNACIEAHTCGHPSIGDADSGREPDRIVVGVMVPEGVLGMPVQILAVDEGDGALCSWLFRHRSRTNNPGGAFRRVRRGAIANHSITSICPKDADVRQTY